MDSKMIQVAVMRFPGQDDVVDVVISTTGFAYFAATTHSRPTLSSSAEYEGTAWRHNKIWSRRSSRSGSPRNYGRKSRRHDFDTAM
ncbi:hypothetical protein KBC59_01305 [Patescibacteria group bacterium]|jgi:hypothetical protein|nr:hypothetical protein [Patescibacteria group bacterium]